MVIIRSEVVVKAVTGQVVFDFMLNCSDAEYQQWWPGTHLAFHTIKRYPTDIGNLVYFDEFIGRRRLKFKAVVTEIVSDRKIVWQMKKGTNLPAWLALEFEEKQDRLHISHTMTVGFKGIGRILDPFLRLYFTSDFCRKLDDHAQIEFPLLVQLLLSRPNTSSSLPN